MRVLFIFGTRPEAIKLCPLIRQMRGAGEFEVRVCVTAQHREMLDQILRAFDVVPDDDLNVMSPGQTLFRSTSRILEGLEAVIERHAPDAVLVQGDTTSTLCGALGGFYRGVAVGHVEAGLRTGTVREPFPEEMNRVLVGRLATYHFAATPGAVENLRGEGVAEDRILLTGNTGIDAVLQVKSRLERGELEGFRGRIPSDRPTILVTAHRRESFGAGLREICLAIRDLARSGAHVVFPVHPNPQVRQAAREVLEGTGEVELLEPLDYVPFVDLMIRSDLLLTDSGGIQEEGPSLGKPVVVMRERTERPEGVAVGAATLVGTNRELIVRTVQERLQGWQGKGNGTVRHVYGDGCASQRIAAYLAGRLAGR
ncbi:MAG TPA: UDP-N-acetylglucosamine 2-epimerase (non-hydrolyzing) [Solibacterales bacterium]|nr:UDP-N-acetylglucosamine 2-epimerase (non-hydrolyzing) [Bryobacterales bacterium]